MKTNPSSVSAETPAHNEKWTSCGPRVFDGNDEKIGTAASAYDAGNFRDAHNASLVSGGTETDLSEILECAVNKIKHGHVSHIRGEFCRAVIERAIKQALGAGNKRETDSQESGLKCDLCQLPATHRSETFLYCDTHAPSGSEVLVQGPMENLLEGLDEQSGALSSQELTEELAARGVDAAKLDELAEKILLSSHSNAAGVPEQDLGEKEA